MNSEHIIDIIERKALSELAEGELTMVRAHVRDCSACREAFDTAQICALLLKERTAESFEPSPFFQTRVLATLRERQAATEQWSWSRMWRATGALASSMVASVAAIAVLTFVVPGMRNDSDLTSAGNSYSAEEVILNQSDLQADDLVSDAQVLNTLYEADEEK
jgi:anti-sigma factor RsiW